MLTLCHNTFVYHLHLSLHQLQNVMALAAGEYKTLRSFVCSDLSLTLCVFTSHQFINDFTSAETFPSKTGPHTNTLNYKCQLKGGQTYEAAASVLYIKKMTVTGRSAVTAFNGDVAWPTGSQKHLYQQVSSQTAFCGLLKS